MFNIGTGEMIMIAVVALLVLGPQRLPELARGIGKFIREFRRQTDDVRNVVEREFYKMDQDVMNPAPQAPQIHAAPEAVPQPSTAIAPSMPLEEPQPPPVMDESDPGHPDYHREEKPAEPEAPAADPSAAPTQKAS